MNSAVYKLEFNKFDLVKELLYEVIISGTFIDFNVCSSKEQMHKEQVEDQLYTIGYRQNKEI